MNLYRICRPEYTQNRNDLPYYIIRFETAMLIKAVSAKAALQLAKKRGIRAPIVEPARAGELQ